MKQANDKFTFDIFEPVYLARKTKRQPRSVPQDAHKLRRRKSFNFLNRAEDVK